MLSGRIFLLLQGIGMRFFSGFFNEDTCHLNIGLGLGQNTNVSLGKGDGYPCFIKGLVDLGVHTIKGLKVFIGGHPVSYTDVEGGICEFLNSHKGGRVGRDLRKF